MIVPIVLLFFTVSICDGNGYRPQFSQIKPPFYRNTQQGNGIRNYPNQQRFVNQHNQHLYQTQRYVNQRQPQSFAGHSVNNGYSFNKRTSPPTPLLRPRLAPRSSFIPEGYAFSPGIRVSERECYEKYVPEIPPAGIGGELAKYGEFLYMVAIGYNRPGGGYDYQCGGTLLNYDYVLTAAHCRSVRGKLAAVVKPGGVRLDDESKIHEPIEIEDIIVHPNYKRKQIYDDIAILKLRDPNYSGIVACLWTKNYINYNTATALGYGQTDTRLSTSNDLYKIRLQLYSSEVCKAYYTPRFRIEKGLTDSQFCAGDFNRVRDTCVGDSGGPLLVKMIVNNTEIPFILGITSFGPGCGSGTPGIYTKVSSYLDWIEPIVYD